MHAILRTAVTIASSQLVTLLALDLGLLLHVEDLRRQIKNPILWRTVIVAYVVLRAILVLPCTLISRVGRQVPWAPDRRPRRAVRRRRAALGRRGADEPFARHATSKQRRHAAQWPTRFALLGGAARRRDEAPHLRVPSSGCGCVPLRTRRSRWAREAHSMH